MSIMASCSASQSGSSQMGKMLPRMTILARVTHRVKIIILGNILPIWDDPLWLAELPETHYSVPFELQGDCVTRNLRIPFGYDPKKILGQSDRDALEKAVATAKDLKRTRRVDALRGEAYQLTPLYQDIPWELMLPPKMRSKAMIDELISTARDTAL